MAEIIIYPVATVIIKTLGSVAVGKIGALYNVTEKIEDLKATLETIGAVLEDAERQQIHNNHVRLWLHRLADVVNDADDFVDGVATNGLLKELTSNPGRSKALEKVRVFFSSSNQIVFHIKLGFEISGFRKRLDKIAKDMRDFAFVEIARPVSSDEGRHWRETHSFVANDSIVGRVEDKMRVLELLLEKKDDISEKVLVVSIFGMGGVGKTTLAQLVFNDDTIQKHFDEKIWVCVSDEFNVKVILGKIVRSSARDTLEVIQRNLREKMNGKRFLLVLDDVWNENPQLWRDLMGVLSSCGNFGSRIVVTARSESVVRLVSNMSHTCCLGILSNDESWSLFKKIAFEQGREPMESNALKIGEEIVKKCGGVPLAIRMIASMDQQDWPAILKREFISSLPGQPNDILPTLKLSYDTLPSHLKHCFAFCRMFPKDYDIDVKTLVNLWVALGCISMSSLDYSQSVEDKGYDHFLELLERCFFQEAKLDKYIMNKVVTCKMHDLVHDLAMQVAGKDYDFLLDPSYEEGINPKVRHVSTSSRTLPSSLLQARRLRSLLEFNNSFFRSSGLNLEEVISNFKFLRMLILQRGSIITVPKYIGKLKHLRYLDLSFNYFESLPTSITELVNLQTLMLNHCKKLRKLPRDMNKLINLRHLEFIPATHCPQILCLPRGVSQLTNLQTLSYFMLSEDPDVASRSSKLDELMGLNNLSGKLEISGLKVGTETKSSNLKGKQHLRFVRLLWSYDWLMSGEIEKDETLEGLQPHPNLRELVIEGYNGARFSSWLCSLTNLVELRLANCQRLKQLSSLESLCSLEEIYLSNCSELEYIITDVAGDALLPSLQRLKLEDLPNFIGWKRSPNITENACPGYPASFFPCLTDLRISYCLNLTSFPLFPTVKTLYLDECNPNPFWQTVWMSLSQPQTISVDDLSKSLSSTFYPISQLKCLDMCQNSKTVLQCFPVWMKSLSSVETIILSSSVHHRSIFEYETLYLDMGRGDESEMPIMENRVTWEIFTSVRKLTLQDVPALKYLCGPIQYLTSLGELVIKRCDDLELATDGNDSIKFEALTNLHTLFFKNVTVEALPEWLRHITSLQALKIQYCENLKTIPDWLCNLSSLQELEIYWCRHLLERCRKETGEDWPLIKHIPNLNI